MKKIANKFLAVILVLVGISIIALSILGLNMRNVGVVSNRIITVQVQNLATINEISEEYQNIYRLTLCHILATNDAAMEDYEKQVVAAESALNNAMKEYSTNITDPEIQTVFSNLSVKVGAYKKTIDSVLKYSKNNDKMKANMYATASLKAINSSLEGYLGELKDATNTNLDKARAELTAVTVTNNTVIFIAFALLLIASIGTYIIARRSIVYPIKKATKDLSGIIQDIHDNQGDLTKRVNAPSKDEIAVLASGINEFLDILQGVISNIIITAEQVNEKEQLVYGSVGEANEAANDTSATMEELAAGMQEVSATVATVNEQTQDVEASADEMSNQAEEGSDFALHMKERATGLKQQAVESKSTAGGMLGDIQNAVKGSVEDSKQIEKITSLTDEILGISSETNLLALNASIEAARAGEAGKGFAVVADQIRVLADNSRKTANNIQEISETVVGSVTLLADNAMRLLNFVNDRVLSDYDVLEQTGEQYLNDAVRVDDIMREISKTAASLSKVMQSVAEANDGISSTIAQSTDGITNVVGNTNDLAEDMTNITSALDEVQRAVEELQSEVSGFTVY